MMNKTAIIGIGNPLMQDDGIGIILLEKLKNNNSISKKVDLLDGGTGGINLIHDLSKYKIIIFLDAVKMGEKPGETIFFNISEINSKKKDFSFSTHEQDLLKIIKISDKINKNDNEIYVYAIQPKDTSFGQELSEPLKQKLDDIYMRLVEKINMLF